MSCAGRVKTDGDQHLFLHADLSGCVAACLVFYFSYFHICLLVCFCGPGWFLFYLCDSYFICNTLQYVCDLTTLRSQHGVIVLVVAYLVVDLGFHSSFLRSRLNHFRALSDFKFVEFICCNLISYCIQWSGSIHGHAFCAHHALAYVLLFWQGPPAYIVFTFIV